MKRIKNKFNRILATRTNKTLVDINLDAPLVSFTFDDLPASAYEIGNQILEKAGFLATYYVALNLMGTENHLGKFFTESQLKKIYNKNNEIACHTFDHLHFYSAKSAEIKNDLKVWIKEIREFFPDYEPRNFSYPYGELTVKSKKIIMNKFVSARGSEYGINYGSTDIYHLKSIGIYNKSLSREKVDFILSDVKDKNAWIIFYTHDIQKDYSDFGCTPDLFEYVVNKCVEEKIEVRTVDEVIKLIYK